MDKNEYFVLFSRLKCLLWLVLLLLGSTLAYAKTPPPISFHIQGIKGEILNNVQNRLKVIQGSQKKPTDKSVVLLGESLDQEITTAMKPFGYFEADINTTLQRTSDTQWRFDIHISRGKAVHIQAISLDINGAGKTDPALLKALKKLPLKKGQLFQTSDYNKAQRYLFTQAHQLGYLKAKLKQHNILINLKQHSAKIHWTLNSGPRYYFGPITFAKTPYSQTFLKRFLSIKTGEVYNNKRVQQLQTQLAGSKFFTATTIAHQFKKAKDNHVPMVINTRTPPSQEYNFGLGYGTNTGTRTSIGANFNHITRSGQHMSSLLNLSQVYTGLSAKYYIPGPQPIRNQYVIGATIDQFTPDNGKAYSTNFSLGYETSLLTQWHVASNLNFLRERFETFDDPYQEANMVYPDLSITYLNANQTINPTRGYRMTLLTRGGSYSTSTAFAQAELSAKILYPATRNSFIILRGDLGATYVDNYDRLPLTLRFFAGGPNSIRGFSYQSLGPGKYIQLASIEYQHRLYHDLYGALFIDQGNVADTWRMSYKQGVGVGLVWRSIVGAIQINATQARSEDGNPWRFDISLGATL